PGSNRQIKKREDGEAQLSDGSAGITGVKIVRAERSQKNPEHDVSGAVLGRTRLNLRRLGVCVTRQGSGLQTAGGRRQRDALRRRPSCCGGLRQSQWPTVA